MFTPDDTIVAVATPPGRGGLGVIRLSGSASSSIAARLLDVPSPLRPRVATLARVIDFSGNAAIDEVVALYFPRPRSYTGDDVVEISGHGSPVLLNRIVELACAAGARLAEPGEFTLRAYLNGRLDLMQAEAVTDLVDAVTPLQARMAFDQLQGTMTERIGALHGALFDLMARLEASLDFPEEGYHFVEAGTVAAAVDEIRERVTDLLSEADRGRLIREGCQVAVVGKPNVGKSSLFNRLLGASRAIVAPEAGTTRDLVTDTVDLHGLAVTLVDTAGIRTAGGVVETEGVSRARRAAAAAGAVVVVLDRSAPLDLQDRAVLDETASGTRLVAVNKTDKAPNWDIGSVAVNRDVPVVEVSALSGDGVERLGTALRDLLVAGAGERDTPAIANLRHIELLKQTEGALCGAAAAAAEGVAEEFVLADLQRARAALEELTGARTPDDVLRHIFDRFCIGK